MLENNSADARPIVIRLPAQLLAEVEEVREDGESRCATLRSLLRAGLRAKRSEQESR
jgi:metal-responsive CopG/Arc/MetJ family transcriptional regulator